MLLKKIYLSDFRNFDQSLFEFDEKITVVVGDNGVGKSNLLESIVLISTGKSFKAGVISEMIAYNKEIARVKALIGDGEVEVKPEAVLTHGEISAGTRSTKKTPKKRLLINGVGKRMVDFASNLRTVIFTPEHMDLVTESPSVRRNFLDMVLSQVDREYHRSLVAYTKALRQRNKLLLQIRDEGIDRTQLTFWDKLLIKHADVIAGRRKDFLDYVGSSNPLSDLEFEVEYDKSAMSEARLKQYEREEVFAGKTLVGPHRDDFVVRLKENGGYKSLEKYGSRGEQRMGVLWIKLSEMKYIEEETGTKPLLLLDDIFSELDHDHRDVVMNVVRGHQSVITTADPHFVEQYTGQRIDLK